MTAQKLGPQIVASVTVRTGVRLAHRILKRIPKLQDFIKDSLQDCITRRGLTAGSMTEIQEVHVLRCFVAIPRGLVYMISTSIQYKCRRL